MSKGQDTAITNEQVIAHRQNTHYKEGDELPLPELGDPLVQPRACDQVHHKGKAINNAIKIKNARSRLRLEKKLRLLGIVLSVISKLTPSSQTDPAAWQGGR